MANHQKVLVTGASGFIGSRLVRQLVDAGEHVKALVRAGSDRRSLAGLPAARVEIVEGDIRIGHTIFRHLAGCDRVYHVAAVNKFWDRDRSTIFEAAVVGTEEVLLAAKQRGIAKVVVTSSGVTLGTTPDEVEMTEDHAFNLTDPEAYVEAKVKAEAVALGYVARGLPVVVVQPTFVVGPADYRPSPGGQLVLRYLTWSSPFMGFPCVDGGMSVVDVDDVATGHRLAMEKGTPGERYVLGGENVTHEQLLNLLSEITGLPGPGGKTGKGFATLVGRLSELHARLTGGDAEVSYRMARDYVGAYVYVSSAKAERDLGYSFRSARKALLRSVQFFVTSGMVAPPQARRIRVDLRTSP